MKTFLASLAALAVLAMLAGAVVVGAKSIAIPINQERYQMCLDEAQKHHASYESCPKTETLWDRGFEDPVAYYTLWLALFTVALAVGALVQSILVGRQISLARDEFISSHRPRLRLRLLQMEPLEVGAPFAIQFDLANIGDTAAKIVEIAITLRVRGVVLRREADILSMQDYTWSGGIPNTDSVAAGESATIAYTLPVNFDSAWEVVPSADWADGRVAIIGVVSYADDRKVKRRTAFYRYCTFDYNRFRFADFNEEATRQDREYED